MRRLGFLDILINKCISKNEQSDGSSLGDRLWTWANKNQYEFLKILANERNLAKEVGRITENTASRYVKFASELGFLTKGKDKELTDSGKMLRMFHVEDFFIHKNPGEQMLFIISLFEKDTLVFTPFMQEISKNQKMTKSEIFEWFAREGIPKILKEVHKLEDPTLMERLQKSRNFYLAPGSNKQKKQGYDLIKHMIDPRIENLVDLGVIGKSNKHYFSNNLTDLLSEALSSYNADSLFYAFAKHLKILKNANKKQIIKKYIEEYEKLATPPLGAAYLPALHFCIIMNTMINEKSVILPSMIDKAEEELFHKYPQGIVFLHDRNGKLTHVNIDSKIKELLKNSS